MARRRRGAPLALRQMRRWSGNPAVRRDSMRPVADVELLGLDHPLVQQELGRWRAVPPKEVGLAVSSDGVGDVLLSVWMVEPTFLSYPVAKAVNPRFGLGWEASIRSTM